MPLSLYVYIYIYIYVLNHRLHALSNLTGFTHFKTSAVSHTLKPSGARWLATLPRGQADASRCYLFILSDLPPDIIYLFYPISLRMYAGWLRCHAARPTAPPSGQ